uniref:Ubiquitin-like domain-containing protein n=1 Tax=Heterorhabditis bacteriophora TaxID=37862 RepID=A0A1I7X8C5_HETBA
MAKMTYGVCVSEYMGDRNRSSVSFSSSGSRLSFGGSIRLNDLLEGDDDYGFRDMDIEEALEATVAVGYLCFVFVNLILFKRV